MFFKKHFWLPEIKIIPPKIRKREVEVYRVKIKKGCSYRRRLMEKRTALKCDICGCCCKDDWQAHHITPRSKGGSNEIENLSMVCPPCHKKIHRQIKKKGIKKEKSVASPLLKKKKILGKLINNPFKLVKCEKCKEYKSRGEWQLSGAKWVGEELHIICRNCSIKDN